MSEGTNSVIQKISDKLDVFINSIIGVFKGFILEVGLISVFAGQSVRLLFAKPYRYVEISKHMEFIGNQSVGIITLTSIFTGLALSYRFQRRGWLE